MEKDNVVSWSFCFLVLLCVGVCDYIVVEATRGWRFLSEENYGMDNTESRYKYVEQEAAYGGVAAGGFGGGSGGQVRLQKWC